MDLQSRNTGKQPDVTSHLAGIKVIHASNPALEKSMTASRPKDPLMKRLMRWLVPDQRVANRHTTPPVVAYLGTLRSSKLYKISDISVAGFYMLTEDRWIAGTGFPVTLERTDDGTQGQTLTVFSHRGQNWRGRSRVYVSDSLNLRDSADTPVTSRVDLTKLAQFLKGLAVVRAQLPHIRARFLGKSILFACNHLKAELQFVFYFQGAAGNGDGFDAEVGLTQREFARCA